MRVEDGTLDDVSAAIVLVLASIPLAMKALQPQFESTTRALVDELMPARMCTTVDTTEMRESLSEVCRCFYADSIASVNIRAVEAIAQHRAQYAQNKAQALATATGQAFDQ
jgi:hypothetical protein